MPENRIPVWFGRCASYDAEKLDRLPCLVGEALEAVDFRPAPGTRVLVKPNLLWADPAGLGYTHPLVVRAACRYLMDCRCRVEVADSPGFGRVRSVAKNIGLDVALASLPGGGPPICEMGPVERIPLALGGSIPIARRALDAELILSLPKLKAHRMVRLSGAVKNLYGCVSGVRKALLHAQYGGKEQDGRRVFPALIADLLLALPPTAALLDGITAMHRHGPMQGEALELGLLAAAGSAPALDTALYTLLGRGPEYFPLWAELALRGVPGTRAEDLDWRGLGPDSGVLDAFALPAELSSESFNPVDLGISAAKRAVAWLRN